MNSEESLWNVPDVARYLNVRRDTIYRWLGKKKMPAIRIGKKWLFRREEIDAWLKTAEAQPQEDK